MMKSTRELIAIIKKACPKDANETNFIADALDAIKSTQQETNSIWDRQLKAKRDYEKKIEEIDKELVAIQKKCKHWSVTYQGDPAGGSDKSETCDICGKDLLGRGYRHS